MDVGALLVVGTVALSVVAGLFLTRGLITLMLSALPSTHASTAHDRAHPAPGAGLKPGGVLPPGAVPADAR